MIRPLTTSLISLALGAALAAPVLARQLNQSVITNHPTTSTAGHTTHGAGRVVPLVCNPTSDPLVSANFTNRGGLTLQLNGGGDANDIVGAFVDGFSGLTLQSVQVDFSGPCLVPQSSNLPEGPNIFVIGNDYLGNGVLAVANCTTPSSSTTLHNGFVREVFLPDVFETFVNTGTSFDPSPNPLVKIIGLDIEASGLSDPLFVRNIVVNNKPASFDTNPKHQVGCLPISAPF